MSKFVSVLRATPADVARTVVEEASSGKEQPPGKLETALDAVENSTMTPEGVSDLAANTNKTIKTAAQKLESLDTSVAADQGREKRGESTPSDANAARWPTSLATFFKNAVDKGLTKPFKIAASSQNALFQSIYTTIVGALNGKSPDGLLRLIENNNPKTPEEKAFLDALRFIPRATVNVKEATAMAQKVLPGRIDAMFSEDDTGSTPVIEKSVSESDTHLPADTLDFTLKTRQIQKRLNEVIFDLAMRGSKYKEAWFSAWKIAELPTEMNWEYMRKQWDEVVAEMDGVDSSVVGEEFYNRVVGKYLAALETYLVRMGELEEQTRKIEAARPSQDIDVQGTFADPEPGGNDKRVGLTEAGLEVTPDPQGQKDVATMRGEEVKDTSGTRSVPPGPESREATKKFMHGVQQTPEGRAEFTNRLVNHFEDPSVRDLLTKLLNQEVDRDTRNLEGFSGDVMQKTTLIEYISKFIDEIMYGGVDLEAGADARLAARGLFAQAYAKLKGDKLLQGADGKTRKNLGEQRWCLGLLRSLCGIG
jgi:hypothetical protein